MSDQPNRRNSIGKKAGSMLKGTFQTVVGVGDTIRGAAMDFVDSATGTARRQHPETETGQQEVERGVNRVTNPDQMHDDPPEKQTADNQAPPLPARREGGAINDVGMPSQVQDGKDSKTSLG